MEAIEPLIFTAPTHEDALRELARSLNEWGSRRTIKDVYVVAVETGVQVRVQWGENVNDIRLELSNAIAQLDVYKAHFGELPGN